MSTETTPATPAPDAALGLGPTLECVTVKVWELPVRVIHWTVFLSVVALSITGFYIGTPFVRVSPEPGFLMGWMRAIHNLAAFVFIAAILARVIWAFTGNQWARWDQFIAVSKERRTNGWDGFRFYAFMTSKPPAVLGHNALAGATYLVLFAMFLTQIVMGLALLSLETEGFLASTTGWVFTVLPIPWVRFIHHLIMWLTWGFVVHHLYSAILFDTEEKTGVLSSIFTGWKRMPVDRL